MNTIEVDDQVLAELASRAIGFHVTPNDVLRKLLNLQNGSREPGPTPPPPPGTLLEYLKSPRFQKHQKAVDRYLLILGWLHRDHPDGFTAAASEFHRGNRAYFAKSEKEILDSGEGVAAKRIPESPFWALTTLDNKTKRLILKDLLGILGYSAGDANLVAAELPDSDIRRSRGSSGLLEGLKINS